MGRSRTPGQVIMMPEEKPAARAYTQLTPQISYQALADQGKRIDEETAKIQGQRYDEVGTPAEIGSRMAGRRVQEAASYLSSLPTGKDMATGFQATGRPFSIQSTPQGTAAVPTTQTATSQPATNTGATTPNNPKYQAAIDAAAVRLADATKAYTTAKTRAATQPRPKGTVHDTPSWAKVPDKTWMPKEFEYEKA